MKIFILTLVSLALGVSSTNFAMDYTQAKEGRASKRLRDAQAKGNHLEILICRAQFRKGTLSIQEAKAAKELHDKRQANQ